MFLKGMLLIVVGIIIFAISFVISYEVENFPSIVYGITIIVGFIFIIIGAILANKSMKKQ